mmetsp:Transcript_9302/g.28720  ORF Transcript_9302/g.28720 Transcript_9302/m.28720 type:complete len:101 (-) Transcript_9302:118-420(-)
MHARHADFLHLACGIGAKGLLLGCHSCCRASSRWPHRGEMPMYRADLLSAMFTLLCTWCVFCASLICRMQACKHARMQALALVQTDLQYVFNAGPGKLSH